MPWDVNWDAAVHISELVIALPVLWKGNRFINKILEERENFPPHRHTNGQEGILYPKGLRPDSVTHKE